MNKQLPRYVVYAHGIFMKIAEPRHIRLMQFIVYICMVFAGTGVLTSPPDSFRSVVGIALVYVFGSFLTLGAILGVISVLPGIWWLERAGILAMSTGLLMYMVMVIALGASLAGIIIALVLALTFAQRWFEIKDSQLAPREE